VRFKRIFEASRIGNGWREARAEIARPRGDKRLKKRQRLVTSRSKHNRAASAVRMVVMFADKMINFSVSAHDQSQQLLDELRMVEQLDFAGIEQRLKGAIEIGFCFT